MPATNIYKYRIEITWNAGGYAERARALVRRKLGKRQAYRMKPMIDVTSAEFTSPDKPHNAEWIVEIESATFDQPAANQHVDKLAVYFRDQAKVDLPVVYPLGVVAGFLEDKEFGLLIRDEAEGKS